MTRTPIQVIPDLRDKLTKDIRRYNLKTLQEVIEFHRTRSYAYERLQRKLDLSTVHIEKVKP